MEILITKKIINFLETIREKKKVTGKDYSKMHREQYWLITRYLRDNGIIIVDGINDRNERMWVLTPKGEKLAELSIQIKKIMEEDN
jgi:hypothetical protein